MDTYGVPEVVVFDAQVVEVVDEEARTVKAKEKQAAQKVKRTQEAARRKVAETLAAAGLAVKDISEALQRLIHRANKQGARFLLLDRDGPVVKGLRRFRW